MMARLTAMILGTLISLTPALWTSFSLAQQSGGQTGTTASGASQPQSGDKETPESGADSEDAAPARKAEDPFDYKASEEISEDLSVSFPADI